jgi:hypothetical protein
VRYISKLQARWTQSHSLTLYEGSYRGDSVGQRGNFVSGEKELREAVREWNQSQIHHFLLQRRIKWTLNPPTGSHHGGVWERCIRTMRKIIKSVIREQVLDDQGINTLMCEVEAIVNGRPITKLSDDPGDMEPLTPCYC